MCGGVARTSEPFGPGQSNATPIRNYTHGRYICIYTCNGMTPNSERRWTRAEHELHPLYARCRRRRCFQHYFPPGWAGKSSSALFFLHLPVFSCVVCDLFAPSFDQSLAENRSVWAHTCAPFTGAMEWKSTFHAVRAVRFIHQVYFVYARVVKGSGLRQNTDWILWGETLLNRTNMRPNNYVLLQHVNNEVQLHFLILNIKVCNILYRG